LETGEQVKTLPVLIVSMACAGHAFAQVAAPAPAPADGPLLVAQAGGGASQGAALPATTTGAGSTLVAVVAAGVAVGLAATLSNGTTTAATASNH